MNIPLRVMGRLVGEVLSMSPVVTKVQVVDHVLVEMRDGVKLCAVVFCPRPKDKKEAWSKGELQAEAEGQVASSGAAGGGAGAAAGASSSSAAGADAGVTAEKDGAHPTIIMRTPYSRRLMDFVAQRFAERGFFVIVQDCRGTGDSDGENNPFEFEEQDGQDTMHWLRTRKWFQRCPRVGVWGMSYLGMSQWALLPPVVSATETGDSAWEAPPDAFVPIMCASRLYPILRPNGGVALSLFGRWHHITHSISKSDSWGPLKMLKLLGPSLDKKTSALWKAHLSELDKLVVGDDAPSVIGRALQEHALEPPTAQYWAKRDWTNKLANAPPSYLIGGWYDLFTAELIADFVRLKQLGKQPFLTVGPWHHFSPGAVLTGIKDGVWWFHEHLSTGGAHAVAMGTSASMPPLSSKGANKNKNVSVVLPPGATSPSPSSPSPSPSPSSPTSPSAGAAPSTPTGASSSAAAGTPGTDGSRARSFSLARQDEDPVAFMVGNVLEDVLWQVEEQAEQDEKEKEQGKGKGKEKEAGGKGGKDTGGGEGDNDGNKMDAAEDQVIGPNMTAFSGCRVRLYVMSTGLAGAWKGYETWPVPCTNTKFYLRNKLRLSTSIPKDTADQQYGPGRFIYDPNNATPTTGGRDFHPTKAGPVNNSKLEKRQDLLVFTSDPLTLDVEMIGAPRAVVYLRSTAKHTSLFVRINCVSRTLGMLKRNRSRNITDGYLDITPEMGVPQENGSIRYEFDLSPTAYLFKKGQLVRIIIASASHPQFQRHPGTEEGPFAKETKKVGQEVFFDAEAPSHLVMPVVKGILPTAQA